MQPSHVYRLWLCGAAVLLTFGYPSGAEEADSTVRLQPRWKEGEKRRFELVKGRRQSGGGAPKLDGTSRTALEIEVLEIQPEGFVVAWTLGETTFDDPAHAKDPTLQAISSMTKDLRTVLELDANASIRAVRNWTDLRDACSRVLEKITADLKAKGVDPAVIQGAHAQVAPLLTSKEGVEQLLTREAQLFYSVVGMELDPEDPNEYEDKLPNPLGGEAFPSRGKFELEDVDKHGGLAKVAWTQTMDPVAAARIMGKTVQELAKKVGKEAPAGQLPKKIDIQDRGAFTVEVSTGWVRVLEYTRRVQVDERVREDRITIRWKG
jgi:hypothetical protein